MYYLIYISKAAKLMEDDDLEYLLAESRAWNEDHHITGMLLYVQGRFLDKVEGRFMQLLEGDKEEVLYIYNKIASDSRHYRLIVLSQDEKEDRHFKTWTMGYKPLDYETFKSLPGFFKLDDDFLQSIALQQSSVPLDLLKSFYDIHIRYDH